MFHLLLTLILDQDIYKNIYEGAIPDTLVWRNRLGYNETMTNNYLRHPAYANYPVVGVNWIQAVEFSKWRTDRVNEKTETEEKRLRKLSDKLREGIEARLINAYDKTRRTYRNGIAVATVERNSCGGCFNNVPPQVHLEIGLHKRVIACEHCGRILVDQSIVSPESMVAA